MFLIEMYISECEPGVFWPALAQAGITNSGSVYDLLQILAPTLR